jgi:hypothetical protein
MASKKNINLLLAATTKPATEKINKNNNQEKIFNGTKHIKQNDSNNTSNNK